MEWKKSGIMVSMALMLGACAHRTPAPVTADVASFNPKVRCSADVDPEHRVVLEMVDTLMARGKNHAALAHLQESVQSNQEYWQRYGQLLAKNGDLQRASLVFTAMRCPDLSDGRLNHGDVRLNHEACFFLNGIQNSFYLVAVVVDPLFFIIHVPQA